MGCQPEPIIHGWSKASVEQARRARVLTAEYVVPPGADLGGYRPIEVWVEQGDRLVVRLKGPDVDRQPRIAVQGRIKEKHYFTIWSEPGGLAWEVWLAPKPLPDILILENDGNSLQLHKQSK